MKIIVIGGGPAGMISAITAAKNGNEVILLEKMQSIGRKLLITGKGRCNITSSLPIEEFISNTPGNGKFLYCAFNNFTNQDIIKFLESHNVKVKEERGNRIFPESDKSISVLQAFIEELKKQRVTIYTQTRAIEIIEKDKKIRSVKVQQGKIMKNIIADRVILATGGNSYQKTGSTGDGYKIAQKLGHTIQKIRPSLVPLEVSDKSLKLCKKMQGLTLKNIKIKILNKHTSKNIYEDFGEMVFTHFGISGPIILSASAHILRENKIEYLLKNEKIELIIDFKPALTEEKLQNRLIREFNEQKNKKLKNCFGTILPKKAIEPVIQQSEINMERQVNTITKQERYKLVNVLKHFKLQIKGPRTINEAIITAGGISVKEIDPKTMESKLISGLYFAGEIIDVDAYTGGFNLQIAYSTGYTAGIQR